MQGSAMSWYNTEFAYLCNVGQKPEDVVAPYDQFIRHFELTYKPEDFEQAQMMKLNAMRKQNNETYSATSS